jgi:hypothetical protein
MSISESREPAVNSLLEHGQRLLSEMRAVDKALLCLGHAAILMPQVSYRRIGRPEFADLLNAISSLTGVPEWMILSKERTRNVFEVRLLVYWFGSYLCALSASDLGRAVGNRQHSTVVFGLTSYRASFETSAEFRQRHNAIEKELCTLFRMSAIPSAGGPATEFRPDDSQS